MEKTTISTRVEPELKAMLEYIARGSGFSLADHIKAALGSYIRTWQQENGAIPQEFITRRAAEIRSGKKGSRSK